MTWSFSVVARNICVLPQTCHMLDFCLILVMSTQERILTDLPVDQSTLVETHIVILCKISSKIFGFPLDTSGRKYETITCARVVRSWPVRTQAGIVQRQDASLPSCLCEFDSRCPLHRRSNLTGGIQYAGGLTTYATTGPPPGRIARHTPAGARGQNKAAWSSHSLTSDQDRLAARPKPPHPTSRSGRHFISIRSVSRHADTPSTLPCDMAIVS